MSFQDNEPTPEPGSRENNDGYQSFHNQWTPMLGVDFNDDDYEDVIKINSNEGRSGDTESVTTLDNLVTNINYLVGN